jgi:hypothetical protein
MLQALTPAAKSITMTATMPIVSRPNGLPFGKKMMLFIELNLIQPSQSTTY